MELNSQVKILESQIRDCFGRVVWSHKTQEKCADIIFKRNNYIKIIQIILSVLTTTGLLVVIFGHITIAAILSAVLSAILFGINMYVKDYDLGEILQKHTEAAVELWNIRESYLSLITDVKANILSIEEITIKRDNLQDKLNNIYKGSIRTKNKAYKIATRALKHYEELTFQDNEIDKLLPNELRKVKDVD